MIYSNFLRITQLRYLTWTSQNQKGLTAKPLSRKKSISFQCSAALRQCEINYFYMNAERPQSVFPRKAWEQVIFYRDKKQYLS